MLSPPCYPACCPSSGVRCPWPGRCAAAHDMAAARAGRFCPKPRSCMLCGALSAQASQPLHAVVRDSHPAGGTHTTHFEPLHKLRAHPTYILKCLISPDSQQLATTSADKTIKLWNLETFTLDRTLLGHAKWVARAGAHGLQGTARAQTSCGPLAGWEGGHVGAAVAGLAGGPRVEQCASSQGWILWHSGVHHSGQKADHASVASQSAWFSCRGHEYPGRGKGAHWCTGAHQTD